MVFLARAHNVSKSIVPDHIGTKLGIFPNTSSWKCDRDNLEKHKTTALNNSVNIFNLYSTIKVHQEAAHISQSKWSAFGAGESTFFGCDNIVSEMSASSTVVLFSVYTVSTVKSQKFKIRCKLFLRPIKEETKSWEWASDWSVLPLTVKRSRNGKERIRFRALQEPRKKSEANVI